MGVSASLSENAEGYLDPSRPRIRVHMRSAFTSVAPATYG